MKPGEETLGEASQMLRDILQSKEKSQHRQQATAGDNNNSLKTFHAENPSLNDFCTASDSDSREMMNSLMRGKSSSSKANSEDNDGQSENYNTLSGDDSDLDSAYGPVSGGDDAAKENEEVGGAGERLDDEVTSPADNLSPSDSKEAKRARVENILTTIRQSPQAGLESLAQASLDMKRQKRKQPQPQQHDVKSLLSPDTKYRRVERMVLQEHIRQLQQQLHAVKRSFHQISAQCHSDDDDDDDDVNDGHDVDDDAVNDSVNNVGDDLDVDDEDDKVAVVTSNSAGRDVENVEEAATVPTPVHNGNFLRGPHRDTKDVHLPATNGLSPRAGHVRDEAPLPMLTSTPLPRFNGKSLADSPGDVGQLLKARDSRNGVGGFGNGTSLPLPSIPPPPGFQRVALTLKSEILQAVTQAVDCAVSNVLEKHASNINDSPPSEPCKTDTPTAPHHHHHQQQTQQNHRREQQQSQSQQQSHQQSQQQSQQQQQHQQQQEPSSHHNQHASPHKQQPHEPFPRPLSAPRPRVEREALKETVSNSQTERAPELVIPYPDHLNFLERFSTSRLPEKMSAFEPLHRAESDLIKPHGSSSGLAFPPHYPYSYMHAGLLPPVFPVEPEQTEALPLVVSNLPKKKRTKVTDTRLSPRAKSALLQEGAVCSLPSMLSEMGERHPALPSPFHHPYLPPVLPTSVAITNPSLHRSDLFNFRFHDTFFDTHAGSPPPHDRSSPKSPPDSIHGLLKSDVFDTSASESMDGQNAQKTCTLTPMHLRKAKLMFFYTRYPNSGILKIYFPDVSFNKNNTAQLVKWFSNFREFFYIQMEKYARQAVTDGCVHADDLVVNRDSELFRHLNLHYNRNNQLEAPETFRGVVESTLREFFRAIHGKKDLESSWKKAIYKVIARLDEPLPEFFKSPNWMEQLGEV